MSVSIIMTALDEPYVNKTIDDVIEKSGGLVDEIIVIDDLSETPIQHPEAKVIRNEQRRGLIWGRNHATELAKSEVVLSIDPHCKVEEGWLKPLVDMLNKERKSIVVPGTRCLNPDKWETFGAESFKTVWDWDLEFKWIKGENPYTPAIAGHCFAFRKDWWETAGRFDTGMHIWGGENIEFPLRTWLFGGSVLCVRDSHVSHWFKKKFQYTFPANVLLQNKARVAEVWFDGYKEVFYHRIKRPRGTINFGDLRERIAIKKRLQEKPFEWFAKNVSVKLWESLFSQDVNALF